MQSVELRDVTKIYPGGVKAVDRANISINEREFLVLVGPSGCGKSTVLRMIAGLEKITEGDLYIEGKRANDVPPKDRDIAMVFQNYALYPHMTVYDNMAFGLKIRKIPRTEIDQRVQEAARILNIQPFLDRRPKALSGGQRQRVAVGRAIVRKPKVFLFDEPLSNLDARLRMQTRVELSSLHYNLQTTMIYVTHDQVEAMTLGDRIVVMKDGVVQQISTPLGLYNNPANLFVAGFIGSPPMNFIDGSFFEENGEVKLCLGRVKVSLPQDVVVEMKARGITNVRVGIRPENLHINANGSQMFRAKVNNLEQLGAELIVYADFDNQDVVAKLPPLSKVNIGDILDLSPDMNTVCYFDPETEKLILGPKAP